MIVQILQRHPRPRPQVGGPTTFKRRTPEESNLAKAQTLQQVFDMIRMLDAEGYPSAFLEIGAFRIEFTRASRKTDHLMVDARITLTKRWNERGE
jgi:methionyl-tRNA formyltransferase